MSNVLVSGSNYNLLYGTILPGGTLSNEIDLGEYNTLGMFTSSDLILGTLTFMVSPLPDAASLRTNQSKSYYTQEAQKPYYRFAVGDTLGVHYNASDTIDATTIDGACLLVVLFEGVNF